MKFCTNCSNMYYIKLENNDCSKLLYYCRNCGNEEDSLTNEKCIIKENISKEQDKFDIYINRFTKLDITLPRINYIKCPNETCLSNKDDFDIKNREIIYIRYDDINMKYLYLCSHCDYSWKTN